MSTTRGAKALLLRLFAALPPGLRRGLVRAGVPTFTVGCVAVIRRDGQVLLLEQPHRSGLALPGGLLGRRETPAQCLRRELREELGVAVECGPQPDGVVVDGRARRVDLVFVVRDDGLHYASTSAEVSGLRWLAPSQVPAASATGRAIEAVQER